MLVKRINYTELSQLMNTAIIFWFCLKYYWLLIYLDSIFGGGNGNPLQYSCLENPVHRGAWWAAVHGVA